MPNRLRKNIKKIQRRDIYYQSKAKCKENHLQIKTLRMQREECELRLSFKNSAVAAVVLRTTFRFACEALSNKFAL
jgi:hypothetical protein